MCGIPGPSLFSDSVPSWQFPTSLKTHLYQTNRFIHPFDKDFLRARSVLGAVVGTGDMAANRTDRLTFLGLHSMGDERLDRNAAKMVGDGAKCSENSRRQCRMTAWMGGGVRG